MRRDRDEPVVGVALTKCFYCLGDNSILLNTRLSAGAAKQVEELHGYVVDMTPCPACEKLMQQGVILITIDDEKSGPDWNKAKIPNPYRTGGWFVVKDEAVQRMINDPTLSAWAIEHRWMFIAHEAAEAVGLFATPATDGDKKV